MVVCLVARIRNLSSRTFHVTRAGDPFYVPKVAGRPCGDTPIEIPPGFDAPAEGLVVPWAVTSRCGLVVGEENWEIRCVVGPSELDDGNTDWLRLHEASWEPIAQEHWLALGKRHFLGAIGNEVELTLTFREREGDASMARSIRFEREAACAPVNTVFLNVYDLASMASIPNSMLCNTLVKTFGAFHAAVEVYGEEWGFYRQVNPDECGICRSRHPRRHPVHVYRQSVNLGMTELRDFECWNLVRKELLAQWPSRRYDLIHCNCIHFCDEFLGLLGAKPVPAWVRGLHETGAALLRIPWPLSLLGGEEDNKDSDAHKEEAHSEAVTKEDTPPDALEQHPAEAAAEQPGPEEQDAEQQPSLPQQPGVNRPAFLPEPLEPAGLRPANRFAVARPRAEESDDDKSGQSFKSLEVETDECLSASS